MSITAGVEAVVRQARDFVCQSAEFRDAVDEAFEAVADSSESSFLGSLLPGQQRRPGVGRSAAGHVATRAFTACTAPLHRAGLPVPVPTTREIDAVFEANSSDGAVLDRAEFRSFCAELLVLPLAPFDAAENCTCGAGRASCNRNSALGNLDLVLWSLVAMGASTSAECPGWITPADRGGGPPEDFVLYI